MAQKPYTNSGQGHSENPKPLIGFAGLTHLGLNSAVASAVRGFRVVGYHDDPALIKQLQSGVPHVLEPGLPKLLAKHREQLTFSRDPKNLSKCDIVYIAVDVPTDDRGASDLTPIHEMIKTAASVMRADSLLVILCQVPPGFTRQIEWPAKYLFYQVETLVFGRAVERALYPERFILGCADPGQPQDERLLNYLEAFECPILPMRYESAELAKISINMCLVASVSVANTMAEICEHIGADWSEIIPALRLDRRIGQYSYINPGLGISGGNLERDLATVLRISESYNTDAGTVSAWLANSRYRKNWPYKMLEQMVLKKNPRASIAILGLAYKENTHSTKNSPAFILIERLTTCKVTVYDPVVPVTIVGDHVIGAASALEAIKGANALVIITPWPEFKNIRPIDIKTRMKGNVVIDPYRMLDANDVEAAGLVYAALGISTLIIKR